MARMTTFLAALFLAALLPASRAMSTSSSFAPTSSTEEPSPDPTGSSSSAAPTDGSTDAPTTVAPTTESPTTEAPTTEAPTTEAPTTEAPTTEAPTTEAATTEAPTTDAPTTEAHTTDAPTTDAPTTEAPTTDAPTTDAPTTDAPTTDAPSTSGPPVDDECARCDYTKGQVWLEHALNCHLYYVCEPLEADGEYRKHLMTCGERYWDQAAHTCVDEPIPGKPCDDVVTYKVMSTTRAPCPYEADVADPNGYFIIGSSYPRLTCVPGLIFINDPVCTCVPDGSIIDPTCSDELLLHFPFDDHFNDVTCHKAIGSECGEELEIVDMGRASNVACFDGGYLEVAFIRTWFARNDVDAFSISLWFKSAELDSASSLVNNGDCEDDGSFEINVSDDDLVGGIGTDGSGQVVLGPAQFGDKQWHHVAWVYDGSNLELYLDNSAVPVSASAAGYMLNPDVPMYVAFLNGVVFKGCIDDLRVYTRALDSSDRLALYSIP